MSDTINLYVGESVGAAAAFAAAAQVHAEAAGTAAAAAGALAAGRIFGSYAAGNSATTSGQYFFVAAGGLYDLHLNGTATPIVRLPVVDVSTGKMTLGGAALNYAWNVAGSNPNRGVLADVANLNASPNGAFFSFTQQGINNWCIGQVPGEDAFGFYQGRNGAADGTLRLKIESAGHIRPGGDNSQNLGTASFRLATVFAGTGTINTSDETEKTWRGAFTAPELAAAKDIAGAIGVFQWNDAIAEKGADPDDGGARLHFGVKAQQVWGIMATHGLLDEIEEGIDPDSKYAFLCWDDLGDGNGRFGVRPDQLALFLIAAQEARIAALEAA